MLLQSVKCKSSARCFRWRKAWGRNSAPRSLQCIRGACFDSPGTKYRTPRKANRRRRRPNSFIAMGEAEVRSRRNNKGKAKKERSYPLCVREATCTHSLFVSLDIIMQTSCPLKWKMLEGSRETQKKKHTIPAHALDACRSASSSEMGRGARWACDCSWMTSSSLC